MVGTAGVAHSSFLQLMQIAGYSNEALESFHQVVAAGPASGFWRRWYWPCRRCSAVVQPRFHAFHNDFMVILCASGAQIFAVFMYYYVLLKRKCGFTSWWIEICGKLPQCGSMTSWPGRGLADAHCQTHGNMQDAGSISHTDMVSSLLMS